MTKMQAMVFAAGLGSRLKPLTDTMPKAMVPVGGMPLIRRVMEKLAASGAERVVVNVHHFARQITDYLAANRNFGLDIRISDESAELLDTGGGLKKAARLFDSSAPILLHNVDILSDVDLAAFYSDAAKADATLLVSRRRTKRNLLFDGDMRLVGWTNTETGEVRSPYTTLKLERCAMYAFAGIHVFSPRLFPLMEAFPDKFGIIDFYLSACGKANVRGLAAESLRLLDVGKPDTLAEAERLAAATGGRQTAARTETGDSQDMASPTQAPDINQ